MAMTTPSYSHPSEAPTLPILLRLAIRARFPLLTIDAAATEIGIGRHTMYAWTSGQRTPHPKTLRDVLQRLDADDTTVAAALMLLASPGGQ